MLEESKNKTVVFVTHRLGAVRHADRIIYIENGSVTESGSFDELLKQRGGFYYLWNEQKKWYN